MKDSSKKRLNLRKNIILQRAFDLDIRIRSNTEIEIITGGIKFRSNIIVWLF